MSPTSGWVNGSGPEGTYLSLSKSGYDGTSAGERIEFQHNGKKESIHAGSGVDTGMKWLLNKKDCSIIRSGEGFAGTSPCVCPGLMWTVMLLSYHDRCSGAFVTSTPTA
jgi:hypothetical protein